MTAALYAFAFQIRQKAGLFADNQLLTSEKARLFNNRIKGLVKGKTSSMSFPWPIKVRTQSIAFTTLFSSTSP